MKSLEGEGRARTTATWDRLPGQVSLKAARWAAWGGALEVTRSRNTDTELLASAQKHLFARVFHQATQKHEGRVTVRFLSHGARTVCKQKAELLRRGGCDVHNSTKASLQKASSKG